MSTEDELQELQLATQPPSKKRKRSRQSKASSEATTNPPKKAKMKKTSKASDEEEDLDLDNSLNLAISKMDPQLLSDYTATRTRKFESELSSIELADKYIPASAIKDTSPFDQLRKSENLPAFLERFAGVGDKKLWGASKMLGSPHTLVVTGAGLRAADLTRILRPFSTKESTIAKLFAKHIKIADQIKFLENCRTGIAVGTPQRLEDLMDDGALNTSRLNRIVIDASHIDIKKRGVLEMKETQIPLMKWLARKEFRDRMTGRDSDAEGDGEKLEILFY